MAFRDARAVKNGIWPDLEPSFGRVARQNRLLFELPNQRGATASPIT